MVMVNSYIKKCILCKSEKFIEDNNGVMIYSICENRCLPSMIIYQYGIDDDKIRIFKRARNSYSKSKR